MGVAIGTTALVSTAAFSSAAAKRPNASKQAGCGPQRAFGEISRLGHDNPGEFAAKCIQAGRLMALRGLLEEFRGCVTTTLVSLR